MITKISNYNHEYFKNTKIVKSYLKVIPIRSYCEYLKNQLNYLILEKTL